MGLGLNRIFQVRDHLVLALNQRNPALQGAQPNYQQQLQAKLLHALIQVLSGRHTYICSAAVPPAPAIAPQPVAKLLPLRNSF